MNSATSNEKRAMRILRNILIVILVTHLSSLITFAWADFNADAKGTTAAKFLELGVDARAEAMGEAYSAVADEASALYWNPGAMTRILQKSASATLMHAPYVASSFFDYVSYAKNINGTDAWGTSLQYFSAGAITQTDNTGFDQGSFTPYDMAASAGYAHRFDLFSVGASAKYVRSVILTSAQTAALDLGVVSAPLCHDKLRLSGVVTNLGGKLKFDQESDRLPLAYRAGAAYQVNKRWLASMDVVLPVDNSPYAAIGSEYLWPMGRDWNMAARAGYNSQNAGDQNGFSGLSFGLGMNFQSISIDYALVPLGDLGLTHRISVSFRFLPAAMVTLPKSESNLHPPEYPDYHDLQPYFDDTPSLRETLQ